MEATDILSSEHRVIERVITTLQTAADRLEAGEAVRPGFFIDAASFIKGFADGCHHQKEEGVLFQMMADHGLPVNGGPIGVMLYEHDQGRTFTKGLREAAEKWQAGDASAIPEVIANTRAYASLLTQHIQKEDNILFPMANRVIPLNLHDTVLERFEHVEHEETGVGIHEKYLALAESLEKEMA